MYKWSYYTSEISCSEILLDYILYIQNRKAQFPYAIQFVSKWMRLNRCDNIVAKTSFYLIF